LEIFGYSSVSGLQSFPPLATRLRGFRQSLSRPKSKNNNNNNNNNNSCKLELRLNCEQRLMFSYSGPISDNKVMCVDDA